MDLRVPAMYLTYCGQVTFGTPMDGWWWLSRPAWPKSVSPKARPGAALPAGGQENSCVLVPYSPRHTLFESPSNSASNTCPSLKGQAEHHRGGPGPGTGVKGSLDDEEGSARIKAAGQARELCFSPLRCDYISMIIPT